MRKNVSELAKAKWYALLMLAIILFAVALMTQLMTLNLLVIGLAAYIYKYGNPVLFKEYNEKRQRKMEEAQTVREAAMEALHSKKIFSKKHKEEFSCQTEECYSSEKEKI